MRRSNPGPIETAQNLEEDVNIQPPEGDIADKIDLGIN